MPLTYGAWLQKRLLRSLAECAGHVQQLMK